MSRCAQLGESGIWRGIGMTKADMTKSTIGKSLHKLLQTKPLDEITVKEIVEDCGISRQTFYYHFQDIYGVVEWRFQQVSQELLERIVDTEDEKTQKIQVVMNLMLENKDLLINIYRALDRSYLNHYLTRWTKPILYGIIQERAKNYRIESDALDFIVDIYVFGLVNILLNWLDRGLVRGPVQKMEYFDQLMEGGLDDMLRRFSTRSPG